MTRATSSAASHPAFEHGRYLLLDARVVDATHNAELALGAVRKSGANPLFGEDMPWEMRFDNLYANVIFDAEERLYKCWYSPFIVDRSAKGMSLRERREVEYPAPRMREMAICYATSEDGLAWRKPELGLVEYGGSKANNILWRGGEDLKGGPHGAGILKDLRDAEPNRRYKAFLKSNALSVAFSADGIRWGPATPCPQADSAGDTHNNAFWAPTLGRYVGITRQWDKTAGRQVARTSSVDFEQWDEAEIVLQGLDATRQTYAMPVFYYGGAYLGLVAVYDSEADRVWTELTWSPDTKTWHRVSPGTPLIANGADEGDCDWGCAYAAACPVFLDDEIRLYYGGSDGRHSGWRNGFFCLATLRPDGFAGYQPSNAAQPAKVTTVPIFDGHGALQVTADVAPGGKLTVRVLAADGETVAESEPLRDALTDADVRWRNRDSLEAIRRKPARLQFAFHGAAVYSFRVKGRSASPTPPTSALGGGTLTP